MKYILLGIEDQKFQELLNITSIPNGVLAFILHTPGSSVCISGTVDEIMKYFANTEDIIPSMEAII